MRRGKLTKGQQRKVQVYRGTKAERRDEARLSSAAQPSKYNELFLRGSNKGVSA
jgi:hypothetical protein